MRRNHPNCAVQLTAILAWLVSGVGSVHARVYSTGELHSTEQSLPTRLDSFEKEIEELQRLLGIPALSIAIVKDQRLLWAEGYGMADLEKQLPATKNTPYAVASITKPVAATLLLQLVERGLVDLDEPARTYSASFKDDSVKVRHLLTHTSEGSPGEKYAYNGDRFRELTEVIEKVSGKPFRQVLVQSILEKLDMFRSVPGHDVLEDRDKLTDMFSADVLACYRETLTEFAKPYTVLGGRAQLTEYPPRGLNAAAGLISTVVDLAKFDIGLDHHVLLTKDSLNKAWTPAIFRGGETLPYGLGWFVQQHQGLRLVWHYGYWQQFSALYLKVPEKNLTFIALANSNGLSAPFGLGDGDVLASPFACGFLRTFVFGEQNRQALSAPSWKPQSDEMSTSVSGFGNLKHTYAYEPERRARTALADWLAKDDRQEVEVDPSVYNAYVGEYELRRDGFFNSKIIITKDRNKLIGSFSGENSGAQNQFELTPESATRFFWKGEAVTFTFIQGPNREVSHLVWQEFGQARRVNKIK